VDSVHINREVCVGSGWCAITAPEVFTVDDAGKSRLLQKPNSIDKLVRDAAALCPVEAIRIAPASDPGGC
jgi:ferredoxin